MEFKEYRLSELDLIIGDGNYSSKYPKKNEFLSYGIPFLSASDFDGRNFSFSNVKYISPELNKKLLKGHIRNGDILLVVRGNGVGKVGYYFSDNNACNINAQLAFIRCENRVCNSEYLYYYFVSHFDGLKNLSTGSAQPQLTISNLIKMKVEVPSLKNQKKIVRVLSSLDAKIELNNKMNDSLYDMLKLEFRNKFYTLNDNLSRLIDLIDETLGGDWGKEKSEGNNNTKVFCIRGADIPSMEFGNKGKAPIRYILEKNYDKKKLTQDSIIIEISGGSPTQSTGRTAYITGNIIQSYENPIICTNFCRAIKLKQKEYAPFLYMTLKLMYEDKLLFNWENGTTGIKNLALSDMLENLEVGIPNDEELNKYNIMFNSIMNKISSNSNENETLIKLRDTLLPKLMNGEIDLENIKV
ncbi:MAG: restriction endonuclease subunit S [Bacilli bacterium]|nr:restriction endonuclease subunit S [Bacilli bacterium]